MSYFDDASLVMIPSGYKTSKVYSVKPTDGSGDLTFSRSNDTATRVGPDGLIEKVRTNLVLQSNSFDTTWTTTVASVTSGQAGYDGTNNAWLLTKSGASGRVNQSFNATAGLTTFSVYAKANASSYIALEFSTSFIYVNLTNGAQGSIGAGTYKIESIGSGWYRISMTTGAVSSIFRIYPAENNDLSATSGSIFIQNAQIEAGDIATDYIATTSAAVSVGPVANVPRLDYLNSSCPRLLLEPQRTNRAQYSEQFSNAFWTKDNFTISSNVAVSPDGYTNADKIVSTSANGEHLVYYFDSLNGGSGTISVFVKKAEYRYAILRSFSGSYKITVFDFNTLTFPVETLGTGKSESYGNGWYRISVSYTLPASGSYGVQFGFSPITDHVYTGDGTSGGFAYGFQFEAGAYATSYIPTLGAAVTRGADAASKTGISSLIGQTEGTVFVEFKRVPKGVNYQAVVTLQGASTLYLIEMYFGTSNALVAAVYNNGAQYQTGTSALTEGTYKAALAYKENDFAFYVNGVQISTDNSGTVPALSTYNLGDFTYSAGSPQADGINQALLFKTRLTNAQLAELTTI